MSNTSRIGSLSGVFCLLLFQMQFGDGVAPNPNESADTVHFEQTAVISGPSSQINDPIGAALSNTGELYVLDEATNSVSKFDKERKHIISFGGRGHSDQEFIGPIAIAASPSGVTAISTGLDRVLMFDPNGKFLRNLHIRGSGRREFARPQGLVFRGEKELVVAASSSCRIERLDVMGNSLGGFDTKVGDATIHPKAVALAPNGGYVVLDGDYDRVLRYDSTGRYLAAFGATGDGPSEFNLASGIATNEKGDIFVADAGNHRVQIFDKAGKFAGSVGRRGSGRGEFQDPRGLAVGPQGDLYVADNGNHRILMFRAGESSPSSSESGH